MNCKTPTATAAKRMEQFPGGNNPNLQIFPLPDKNIARVRNCPDVTILNSLFGLCLLSFCLFVFSPFCLFAFLSFCILVFWPFCLYIFMPFCLFVWTSCRSNVWRKSSLKSHSLCQNSKVALTDPPTQSLTKVRYRAARAAKNHSRFVPILSLYITRKKLKILPKNLQYILMKQGIPKYLKGRFGGICLWVKLFDSFLSNSSILRTPV